jgi:hypothetical protein
MPETLDVTASKGTPLAAYTPSIPAPRLSAHSDRHEESSRPVNRCSAEASTAGPDGCESVGVIPKDLNQSSILLNAR